MRGEVQSRDNPACDRNDSSADVYDELRRWFTQAKISGALSRFTLLFGRGGLYLSYDSRLVVREDADAA